MAGPQTGVPLDCGRPTAVSTSHGITSVLLPVRVLPYWVSRFIHYTLIFELNTFQRYSFDTLQGSSVGLRFQGF